jgi:hypothetical protein
VFRQAKVPKFLVLLCFCQEVSGQSHVTRFYCFRVFCTALVTCLLLLCFVLSALSESTVSNITSPSRVYSDCLCFGKGHNKPFCNTSLQVITRDLLSFVFAHHITTLALLSEQDSTTKSVISGSLIFRNKSCDSQHYKSCIQAQHH